MSADGFVPVRKGALVILHQRRSYNSLLMGAYAGSERYVPAIVTAASRTGTAKKAQTKTSAPVAIDSSDRVLVVSAATLQGADPEAVRDALAGSFDSLAELKTALVSVVVVHRDDSVSRCARCDQPREPLDVNNVCDDCRDAYERERSERVLGGD